MNDSNRNTRTLIVSFVIAIMFLIPLRFVEVGQSLNSQTQVLGETIVVEEPILPDSSIEVSDLLEAPYNELDKIEENINCLTVEEVEELQDVNKLRVEEGNLTPAELDEVVSQMIDIENNICR